MRQGTFTGAIGFQFFAPFEAATPQADPFYAPLLAGAQAEAQKAGLHLLLHSTDRHQLSHEMPRMIQEQAVSGMLLVGMTDPEILSTFLNLVPQIVLVDNRDTTGRHDCVFSDGVDGALNATNYLFTLGHRRIGFVMSEPETATFQDRLTGYLSAHFRAGYSTDPTLIVSAQAAQDLPTLVGALLSRPDRPTALLAANDPHAYILMQVCRSIGLRIPDDISIIGFDDDQYSGLSYPSLTTMHVDTEYMGRLAVRRLLLRLQEAETGGAAKPSVNIELPVSLIVRDSCRAI